MSTQDTNWIDALLDETPSPRPSDDLMARVLADADAVQNAKASRTTPAAAPRRKRWGWMGGWTAAGSLGMAAVAGLAIGFSAPGVITSGVGLESAYQMSDLLPGYATDTWMETTP